MGGIIVGKGGCGVGVGINVAVGSGVVVAVGAIVAVAVAGVVGAGVAVALTGGNSSSTRLFRRISEFWDSFCVRSAVCPNPSCCNCNAGCCKLYSQSPGSLAAAALTATLISEKKLTAVTTITGNSNPAHFVRILIFLSIGETP